MQVGHETTNASCGNHHITVRPTPSSIFFLEKTIGKTSLILTLKNGFENKNFEIFEEVLNSFV